MANYIERIDVMKICEGYSEHCFNSSDAKGQDIADRILDDVEELPTADVEEVKHGEWKSSVMGTGAPHCSLCNGVAPMRYIYCPNCGAKMDGGNKNGL